MKYHLEEWTIHAWTDEDGHLSILVEHKDGTMVHETGWDPHSEPLWPGRFTTDRIEEKFKETETTETTRQG